jgi:X-X-X-Leu-X-X-Gly heptad repeat protein
MLKKATLILFAAIAVFAATACDEATTALTTAVTTLPSNEIAAVKDETIYLEASSSGAVTDMVVVSRLADVETGLYVDKGAFRTAENLSGTASILIGDDALLVPVLADAEEHYYRATLENGYEPPFLISLEYLLDGTVSEPSAAGGSEHAIHLEVTSNPDAADGFRDVFLCMVQISIASTGIDTPTADGGLVILSGGDYVVTFTVLPGKNGTFEVLWSGDAFGIDAIQATYTRFTSAFLGDSLSGFADQIPTLTAGFTQLADGTGALRDGLSQLATATHALSAGAADLSSGLVLVASGLEDAADAAEETASSLALLSGAASALEQGESDIADAYANLLLVVADVQATFSALHSDDVALLTKLATLAGTASAIDDALSQHLAGMSDFSDNVAALAAGYAAFASGLRSLADAATGLASGSEDVSTGLASLDEALALLPDQIAAMNAALVLLSDGFTGSADELAFLFADSGASVSFTSADNPAPRSVQFIYTVSGF